MAKPQKIPIARVKVRRALRALLASNPLLAEFSACIWNFPTCEVENHVEVLEIDSNGHITSDVDPRIVPETDEERALGRYALRRPSNEVIERPAASAEKFASSVRSHIFDISAETPKEVQFLKSVVHRRRR